jgi:ABC-2 type transport system permease protein
MSAAFAFGHATDNFLMTDLNPAATIRPMEPEPTYFVARQFKGWNPVGLQTLYLREVRRFFKVAIQTVLSPVVSTLLFMMVFAMAFGGAGRPTVLGATYSDFLAPGLIMMSVLNNAFQNSSSSMSIAKMQGNSVDFLMPPLSPWELTAAFVTGAATRGVIVGAVSALAVIPFANVWPAHWWAVLYFGVISSLMMGAVGLLGGIWAEKFDQLAAVTNFIITPLSFLSGTFYLVDNLPEPFRSLSHANPFFYLIDGFRYGFIGKADGNLMTGALVSAGLTIALCVACRQVLASGYRLKS